MASIPEARPLHAGVDATRLEQAITMLRRRLEQHFDQQSRLQSLYREWQSRWIDQCCVMSRQFALLEGHLAAWMQHWPAPRLTVVTGDVNGPTA